MATNAGAPAADHPMSLELVGSAFVDQYYKVLRESPDQIHRFYQDSSTIGRAGSDGVMVYVTTLDGIHQRFMSVDYTQHRTEIVSVDAVASHDGGIFVVVTGSSTTLDAFSRRFTQSFFLAPEEHGGYFVLSDILRMMPETTVPVAINQAVDQEASGNSPNDGSVVDEITEDDAAGDNKVGDWEVVNPSVDCATAGTNVSAEPPVQVTKEGPPPPKKGTRSLFSRLLCMRG